MGGAAKGEESCRVAQRRLRSARGGGFTSGYLQESRCLWLAALCDASRSHCRDQASPRGPAPAAAAARRAGWPSTVSLSICPSGPARAQRRGAAGGAGRGWPPGYRPLGPSSSRHLASALSQRSLGRGRGAEPPAAVGSGELAARQADRCLDTEAALRGARPSPDPSAESPLERRALSGWELERAPRLPTARPQGLGARQSGGKPTSSSEATEAPATASGKSRPKRHCRFARIFLGSLEAPTCFKTKCEGGNSPTSCLFTTSTSA